MRWTRRCCRRTASKRTEKSCGPGAPTLALRFVDDDPRNDGGKRARSPGRARRKPLKPSRGESRLIPSEPVVTMLVCFSTFAREAAGAVGTRLSLRPLFSGRNVSYIARAHRAAGFAVVSLAVLKIESGLRLRGGRGNSSLASAKPAPSQNRHCERSEAIHASLKEDWIASSLRSPQ